MGVNAEGKISLSVELQNFKDIAGSLKKGLSEELKQVPLDVQFNNKDLEKKAAAALRDINEMFSKTRLKNLDFSSILPAFINEINRGDISDEIRYQVIEGFRTGLNNLKTAGATTQNYSKIKGFDSKNLLKYFSDVNDVEDVLDSFKGLSKRQKQGLRTSVLPSLSELKGRGWDTADKEYTKGAKRLDAILQLSSQYGDVVQYGTNPTATKDIIKELDKRFKEGNASKIDAEDLIGYLLRSNFLNIDLKELDIDSNYLLKESKNILGDKADKIENALKERTQLYFMAYDEIFNSSAAKVDFSDISKGLTNTTNKRLQSVYNAEIPENEKIEVGKLFKETVKIKSDEKPELRKREKREDVKDTTKPYFNEDLKDFEFDEEEDKIQDYNDEIQKLDNKLNELDQKLDELSDKATLLQKEIPQEEEKLNNLNTQIKQKENKIEVNKNRNNKRLNYLNERKEGLEFQDKDLDIAIDNLQKRKEELNNKLFVLKEEEEKLSQIPSENFKNWGAKQATESYIEEIKKDELNPLQAEIELDEETLNRTYEAITSKRELTKLLKEKLQEIKNNDKEIDELFVKSRDESVTDTERRAANLLGRDKLDVRSRLNLDYSKIYKQAVKQGVSEKVLQKYYKEGLEIDDLAIVRPEYSLDSHNEAIRDNLFLVEEQLEKRKEKIQEVQKKIEEAEKELAETFQKLNGFDMNKHLKRREEIPKEEDAAREEIKKINDEIFEKQYIKKRNNSLLRDTQLDINDLQSQDSTQAEQELQQLKQQRDNQKRIYDEKKQANEEILEQMKQVDEQMNKIQNQRESLIQKQEILNQQKEEARKRQEEADKQQKNKSLKKTESENETTGTQNSRTTGDMDNTDSGISIPPEQLREVLTLLDSIQKTLGTLEDGSDIPSITQSVKDMADALKELSSALGEIKQKDFNLNIGLPNNNSTTTLQSIFEDMKISIDASLAQINTESKGFNFLSGSAEEAAEAKRKFVEANKNVLQSIVASMPKLEEEADALKKVEEVQNKSSTKTPKIDSKKEKEKKGYSDFEAMPNDLIEQRYNEISPFPIIAKGVSLATNKLDDETQSAVESLEELHTAWDREQQEIKDIIHDTAIENIQQEYIESQLPIQYNFEPDYDDIERQAQEARQYYEDQISNDFELKIETKLDLKEDETGQLSLFDNILPEENWGQDIETKTNKMSEIAIKGQISFQQLQEAIENSEQAFAKLTSFKNTNGKSFLQNTDIPNDFLKKYENISTKNGEGYKATSNLKELKNLGDELADVKTKLKMSFDEAGNLKSTADPFEVQELLGKYDELVNKIQNLRSIISSPSSQESFLLEEFKQIATAEKEASDEAENFKKKTQETLNKILIDKKFTSDQDINITNLDEYFKVGSSEKLDKVRSIFEELKILKEQLKASRGDDGGLIGEPKAISELIERYNLLSKTLQSLITQIKLPNSVETIGLKMAKDAEKAKKELDGLKEKVDDVFNKSNLFEAQTEKTINTYGAFNGEEGQRTDLIASDKLGEKYGDRFAKQQEQVQQLIDKLRDYRTAIKELEALRTSDDATIEQLTEANDKVKNLKDSITNLSQTIKTSGIANASEEQLGALKNRLEIFLEKNPNLTSGIRQQIQEYINILNSGASVSKTRYASMTADLNKFAAAQTSGRTIWEQMVGKMREGIAFLATKFSFYEIFNQFRQGFEVIHQFDDALTEMMKVSDETRLSLERYQKTTFDTADAIGTSALQIQNSTADFMRLGETLNEAAESAKSANVLMNVSEFQSIDEATKSLIAMSAAYDDLSKMNIIDKLNEVGNNFSISTSEAAEALQSSASALQTAGNSMDESLALITAGNAVVQDANKVGTGMRTIALRLTGKQMCPNIE